MYPACLFFLIYRNSPPQGHPQGANERLMGQKQELKDERIQLTDLETDGTSLNKIKNYM
jgi:hypothetical protein